jgi:hypothetical protein
MTSIHPTTVIDADLPNISTVTVEAHTRRSHNPPGRLRERAGRASVTFILVVSTMGSFAVRRQPTTAIRAPGRDRSDPISFGPARVRLHLRTSARGREAGDTMAIPYAAPESSRNLSWERRQ